MVEEDSSSESGHSMLRSGAFGGGKGLPSEHRQQGNTIAAALPTVHDLSTAQVNLLEGRDPQDQSRLVEMVHSTTPSGLESATHSVDRETAPASALPPDLSRLSHKKIDSASLQRKEKLGAGAAGIVYKAVWLGAEVAEKTFVGSDDLSFQREVSVLAGLSHPNITTLLAYAMDREYCSIVTELMDGDLSSLMHSRMQRNQTLDAPFSISEAVGIIVQIAEGVNYLHDRRVVHRDLKASNVLVKCEKSSEVGVESVNAKVSDFGLSKTKESSHTYSNQTPNTGSTRWMAPELYQGNHVPDELKHPFKSDGYSFGMLCYEILTGKVPFSDTSSPREVRKKVASGHRPQLPAQCPQELRILIESCWNEDASARPCFADILADLKCLKRSLPTGLKHCVDGHTARSSEDSRRGSMDRSTHERLGMWTTHMSLQRTALSARGVEREREQCLEVKNKIYNLVGIYSMFQGTLLTASQASPFLQGNSIWVWIVVSLSALAALVASYAVLVKFRHVWTLERLVASERLLRQSV